VIEYDAIWDHKPALLAMRNPHYRVDLLRP